MVYNRQIKMKKILYIAIVGIATVLCSCGASNFIPRAVNTINSVTLEELNLARNDYEIINTITAEATVSAKYTMQFITMQEGTGEFKITSMWDKKNEKWVIRSVDGIARLGYLSNDYANLDLARGPEDMARNIAVYRLINLAKTMDADGVIEPVISTSAEQTGHNEVTFKSVVQAKVIKLKTNK